MTIAVLGIDVGRVFAAASVWTVAASHAAPTHAARDSHRHRREATGLCRGMEACRDAHHIGRSLAEQGQTVRLMSPEDVRSYGKARKNDDRDPDAGAEAATRPTMRFVALKSEAQLDVRTLRRVHDQLAGERTTLTNPIRSIT